MTNGGSGIARCGDVAAVLIIPLIRWEMSFSPRRPVNIGFSDIFVTIEMMWFSGRITCGARGSRSRRSQEVSQA